MTTTMPSLRGWLGGLRRTGRRRLREASHRVRLEYTGRFGPTLERSRWVFLVGCFNSGTTLLHDLLAQHPDVASMPDEGQFFTDQLLVPRDVGLRRLWALEPARFYLDETGGPDIDVVRLKRQWGAQFNDPRRPVLLEKTPANAARTRWLQRHFHDARFIAIVRDGRAVAEGIHRKTGHPLDVAARQWARSNEVMLRDLAHLRKQCLVRYEELTDDTARVVSELLTFLDLPPAALATPHRTWKIHEQEAVIQNMNGRSLASLSAEDLQLIDREAGHVLRELGYVDTATA
jgi:hypothetical protein